MRDDESLARQIRDLLKDSEELKTAQFVGTDQVKVQETISNAISVSSDADYYITRCYASCRVTATDLNPNNVLICYCIPEVRLNGTIVGNLDGVYQLDLSKADEGFTDRMGFQANIFHIDDSGSQIPAETYTVKFHIFSTADVTIQAWEGVFDE